MRQLSKPLEDSNLVACVVRARRGSRQACEVLVEHFYDDIRRYLLVRTGHREVSEDLTQNAFLTAVKGIHQLHDPEAFPAWLFQIARNEWRMWLRRKSSKRLVSIDEATDPVAFHPYLAVTADGIERLPKRDLVLQTFAQLSPSLQEALYLRCVANFSDGEIATILDISAAAAQKRAYRAEIEFRKRYDELSSIEHQEANKGNRPWETTPAISQVTN